MTHLDPVGTDLYLCQCDHVVHQILLSFVLRFECSKSPLQRGGLFVEVLYYYQRLH